MGTSKKDALKGYKDPWFETRFHVISIPLARWLSKTRITANLLTTWSLWCCLILAAVLVLIKENVLPHAFVGIAGICALGFWVLDTIDGKVARLQRSASPFGGWLDVTYGMTGVYLALFSIAYYTGHFAIGLGFLITYLLKVFYCGAYQEQWARARPDDKKFVHGSYAPNKLAEMIAAMNATNTIFLSLFVAAVVSYFWWPIFLVMEVLYIVLNGTQALTMVIIQYQRMKAL